MRIKYQEYEREENEREQNERANPMGRLLDTIRFSYIGETVEEVRSFLSPLVKEEVDCIKVVRIKSTHDDPNSPVKQEIWNCAYKPKDLTYKDMVGKFDKVETYRWNVLQDVDKMSYEFEKERLMHPDYKLHNEQFKKAVDHAKEKNPSISPYIWITALRYLLETLSDEPLEIVVELQVYLKDLLELRKEVHGPYTITRCIVKDPKKFQDNVYMSRGLKLLAQDQRKRALNSSLAYNDAKHT
eukprot:m.343348 g.343348  ORF g.343348 m.343348 type:complete len:242 (-) comp22714_c0_seq1:210-935(-)